MLALTSAAYVSFICKAHLIQSFNELLIIEVHCSEMIGKKSSGSRVSVVQKLPIIGVYYFFFTVNAYL